MALFHPYMGAAIGCKEEPNGEMRRGRRCGVEWRGVERKGGPICIDSLGE